MLKQERQSIILRELDIHNKVLSSDLSIKLEVSEDTIRRDLNELTEQGKITKVHGGALSKSYHLSSYPKSKVYSVEKKTKIAKKQFPYFATECLFSSAVVRLAVNLLEIYL